VAYAIVHGIRMHYEVTGEGKLISSNKAYIDLGWAAEINREDGVRRTADWYTREVLAASPAPGGGA
jgi:nucleoside-diphosphate-sugar epimerase